MGLFKKVMKDMFSGDPWAKVDPELKFKKYLMKILSHWELSKLTGLMQMYEVFEQDFFLTKTNYNWSAMPDDTKLELFIPFINNFGRRLLSQKDLESAQDIFEISIKLKKDSNAAYCALAGIFYTRGFLKKAAEMAKIAIEDLDIIKTQCEEIPSEIRNQFDINLDYDGERKQLLEFINKCNSSDVPRGEVSG